MGRFRMFRSIGIGLNLDPNLIWQTKFRGYRTQKRVMYHLGHKLTHFWSQEFLIPLNLFCLLSYQVFMPLFSEIYTFTALNDLTYRFLLHFRVVSISTLIWCVFCF